MDALTIILWLIVGAVAGWIAGELMRGHGFGLIGNIIIGIIGAVIGGLLFSALGIGPGFGLVGSLITSIVGAVVLLFLLGLFQRRTI
jgi:uncharacterized membrane protein YeaQ/YmgE (transglycosylase-associated protein family)